MTLVEKLKAAGEGSRDLDVDVREAVLPGSVIEGFWPGMSAERVPRYTTSLDAAMSLFADEGRAFVELSCALRAAAGDGDYTKFGAIKRLCIAALTARGVK